MALPIPTRIDRPDGLVLWHYDFQTESITVSGEDEEIANIAIQKFLDDRSTAEAIDPMKAVNFTTIRASANNALTTNIAALALPDPTPGNTTFLALPVPTQAQTLAQVKALTNQMTALRNQVIALTKQNTALIRLVLGKLDSTDGV